MSVAASAHLDAARRSLARGGQHLRALQHPEGWWKGELETNVTIDAEDLFVRHFLDALAQDPPRAFSTVLEGDAFSQQDPAERERQAKLAGLGAAANHQS